MDHLLNEIDADVRAEKMAKLWQRYRRPLFIAIAAIIALTAADSIWKQYRETRGGERLAELTAAHALYEGGKAEDAAEAFAIIAEKSSGEVRTVAELWQGRSLLAANKTDGAAAAFEAASKGTPGLWSDLACLRLASLDSEKAAGCLASMKDTPLLNQRREWYAATQWATGDQKAAIATFEELATSRDASEAERNRISQWLSTLQAQSDTAKPAEDTAAKPAE